MRAVGLMSGTSLDGMDAALVRVTRGRGGHYAVRLDAFVTRRHPPALRRRLAAAAHDEPLPASEFARLDADFCAAAARTVRACCRKAGVEASRIDVIGSHGQTVHHGPAASGEALTWQLGSPARIATLCGVPTVGDFRTADVAAGGEGAPLMPIIHRMLLAAPRRARAIQNLGGIGNVTWLSRGGREVRAFDTGPGVMLIDEVVRRMTRGAQAYDRGGRIARRGTVQRGILAGLMRDRYLTLRPPKSTGRERFGAPRAERLVRRFTGRGVGLEDAVATTTAFTAASIADQYARFLGGKIDEVWLAGGGARNPALVDAIRAAVAPLAVDVVETLGVDGDALEAIGFAVLAAAHVDGVRFDLRSITGARGRRRLGVLATP